RIGAREGAPGRALGWDTSTLPLTRWRSGFSPMPHTASFPIHHVKQPSFFPPGSFFVRVLLPLFAFLAADPERVDWRRAPRRAAWYVSRSNARRHACEAIAPPPPPGSPPHG